MQDLDHNKLIRQAAKAHLTPLGCQQKGRSRLWYADQGWWAVVIEFQPSAWSRGSYLNAAAMWLWHAQDYWAFHESRRVGGFREFSDEEPGMRVADELASQAAEEVERYRLAFSSIEAVADHLQKNDASGSGMWGSFHAGMAAAFAGRVGIAVDRFNAILNARAQARWEIGLQSKARVLAAASPEELVRLGEAEIRETRKLLKLSERALVLPMRT